MYGMLIPWKPLQFLKANTKEEFVLQISLVFFFNQFLIMFYYKVFLMKNPTVINAVQTIKKNLTFGRFLI